MLDVPVLKTALILCKRATLNGEEAMSVALTIKALENALQEALAASQPKMVANEHKDSDK